MSRQIFRSAPNFVAASTHGEMDFHAWKAGRWAVLLSCPFAFTPVCTTELVAFSRDYQSFVDRGVAVAAMDVDALAPQMAWVDDIHTAFGVDVPFPLIADGDRAIARAYGMITPDQESALLAVAPGRWMKSSPDFAVRTAFIVSPANTIALSMSYPPNVGLSVTEIVRVLDALRLSPHKLAAPANWQPGEDVVVGRVLPDEVARTRFGAITTVTPYLRTVAQPHFTYPPCAREERTSACVVPSVRPLP